MKSGGLGRDLEGTHGNGSFKFSSARMRFHGKMVLLRVSRNWGRLSERHKPKMVFVRDGEGRYPSGERAGTPVNLAEARRGRDLR